MAMKRIFAFAATSLMLVSCVVSEETNKNRTHNSLSWFTSDMIRSSVEVTLRNLVSYPEINAEGFSRTCTVDNDVQPLITRVGDNAWTSSYSVPGMEFSLNAKRLPSESRLGEKWVFSGLELKYSEGDDYSFTLRTENDVTYSWEADEKQLSLEYDLVPSGVFMGQFYARGQATDWCRYSYDKGSASSTSSLDRW